MASILISLIVPSHSLPPVTTATAVMTISVSLKSIFVFTYSVVLGNDIAQYVWYGCYL